MLMRVEMPIRMTGVLQRVAPKGLVGGVSPTFPNLRLPWPMLPHQQLRLLLQILQLCHPQWPLQIRTLTHLEMEGRD